MDPKDDNATNPVPSGQPSAQGSQNPPEVTDTNSFGAGTSDSASSLTPDANNDMPSLASEESGANPAGGDVTSTPGNAVGSIPPTPGGPDAPGIPPADATPPVGGAAPPAEPEVPLSPMPNRPFEPSGTPPDNATGVPPQPSPQSDIPPTAPVPVPASAGDKKTFMVLLVVAVVLIAVAAFLLVK